MGGGQSVSRSVGAWQAGRQREQEKQRQQRDEQEAAAQRQRKRRTGGRGPPRNGVAGLPYGCLFLSSAGMPGAA